MMVKTKQDIRITPKEKAKEFLEKARPHVEYWDCRNDSPLEYDHLTKITMIWVNEILDTLEWMSNIKVGDDILLDES